MITHPARMKPGRNDPCYCGSGQKYKKCCCEADEKAASAERRRAASIQSFSYEEVSPEILALKEKLELRQRGIREYLARDFGVLINIVPPADFGGRKVWAIGNRVFTDRPPDQTFHEFMIGLLREALGREWGEGQGAIEAFEQHYLFRCFREYGAWTERISREQERDADRLWSAAPNGFAQYLISVAWDVASLLQATGRPLPESLLERLGDARAFQGARYELAIAGLFARLNCEIEFLDDAALRDRKHGEFIATHRPSGQAFVIEAKSRHREGVINQPGEFAADNPLRGDKRGVRKLLRKAMEKDAGGLPFLIFIDINAPAEDFVPGVEPKWQMQVKAMAGRMPGITAAQPAPFNALYVTNFSSHYQDEDLARGGEWLSLRPRHASASPLFDLIDSIDYALDRFDRVPDIGIDGKVR